MIQLSDDIVTLNRRILERVKTGQEDPEDCERRDQLLKKLQSHHHDEPD